MHPEKDSTSNPSRREIPLAEEGRMETTVNARVGWVVEYRLPELDERIERVAKQARKLGLEPMRYTRTGREDLRVIRERRNGLGETVRETALFIEVEIHGEIPRLPGNWQLLAVVNHEEGMPIVKCVPGRELPAGQRERGTVCDHCRTSRDRKDTFVLQAEDGRVVQIGRNCVADFLGVSNFKPDALLAVVAFLTDPLQGLGEFEYDGEGDCGSNMARGRLMIDVLGVVVASGAAIDEEGWVSRKRAQEAFGAVGATADSVSFILWPPRNPTRDDGERMAKYRARMNDTLKVEAALAIEWAKSFLGSDQDYLNNLAVCATRGAVGADKLGIVVSLIASYRREQAQLRDRERKVRNAEFVGEVKLRLELELTLVAAPRAFEGNYGTTYRCEFTDAAGHVFVWWASNDPCDGGREGGWKPAETRKVKATVKKHEEFKGIKMTVLTRVSETK